MDRPFHLYVRCAAVCASDGERQVSAGRYHPPLLYQPVRDQRCTFFENRTKPGDRLLTARRHCGFMYGE